MKRVITWISAMMMVFQLGIPAHADETKVTYETILGEAANFGIVADSYEQFVHTQTNFAVKKYGKVSDQVVEVNIAGEGDVPFIVGEIDSALRFGGQTANNKSMTYDVSTSDFYQQDENTKFISDNRDLGHINVRYYSQSAINRQIDSYIGKIQSSSKELASRTATINVTNDMIGDINHFNLDLSGYGDTTVIVNVPSDATVFDSVLRTTGSLNIIKNEATTVVFNIENSDVYIGKYNVTVNNQTITTDTDQNENQHNKDVDEQIVRKIYWNLYNANSVELNVSAGLFLIPSSYSVTTVSGTSAGWIQTGGKVQNTNGECHFIFHARTPVTLIEPDTPVTPSYTSVNVQKVWDDEENSQGMRTDSVTVRLYINENPTDQTVTLNESNQWKASFDNLISNENNNYSVQEEGVPTGYVSAVKENAQNDYTITNTSEKVNISGTKTWNDNGNEEKRPSSITVRLYADGIEKDNQTVTAEENWNYSFNNLPKYSNGTEIKYTVSEDAVDNYTSSINGYDISNTYTPNKTSVTVRKAWDDADNQDGIRSKKVTAELYADGKKVDSAELFATRNWEYTFKDLPTYSNGKEINYTVKEANVDERYTSEVTGDATTGYTITNKHTPEVTSVTVNKIWDDNNNQDGKRPESITVRLFADGKEYTGADGNPVTATLTAADKWTYTFENLPKKKAGKDIVYTVSEDAVTDYSTKIETGKTTVDITNTHTPGKTSISVSKAWEDSDNLDGIRPESVTVRLYADGEATDKTVELNDSNKWLATFTELDEYKEGNKITYTVAEENVTDGYVATVTGDAITGYVITNTHAAEVTAVSGTKTWNDNNNQFGRRPESITVRLYADGTETYNRIVTAESDWTYSFDSLPKYSNGKEITYTVQEDAVTDYTTSVDGYDITNTFETVRINGQKVWNDNNNAGNTRPESITVQLYANGVKVAETTANKDLDWFFSFGELPVYENGEKITYTVTETPVEGYRSSVSGDAVNGFTVRNTLRPQTPTTDDKDPTITPTTPTKRRPQTPFTSDTSNVALYGGLTLVALTTVIGILIRRREN